MEEESSAENATSTIHTYHCICHTLILAASRPLESSPARASSKDGAKVVRLFSPAQLVHTIEERKPIIVRREDGFEKRTLLRCERCELVVGYKLDAEHYDEGDREVAQQILYVLPGALNETEAMMADKSPEMPAWAKE